MWHTSPLYVLFAALSLGVVSQSLRQMAWKGVEPTALSSQQAVSGWLVYMRQGTDLVCGSYLIARF